MEPNELIQRYLLGRATDSEIQELDRFLATDPVLRRQLISEASLDSGLREMALERFAVPAPSLTPAPSASGRWPRWPRWRPLTAAAAGIALGVLSASMVWAYAVPLAQRMKEQRIPFITDSLEDAALTPVRGFPRRANQWAGDLSIAAGSGSDVRPAKGKSVARLAPNGNRRLGYVWRIIDLSEYNLPLASKSCRIEVLASYTASAPAPESQYQIRLAAFSQAPEELRAIWNNEPLLFDTVLQHIGRNVHTTAGDTAWHEVRAALDIPPGTRSLVICLGAGNSDPAQPRQGHFLDAVQARFVVRDAAPK
jgi:hypothetical protein